MSNPSAPRAASPRTVLVYRQYLSMNGTAHYTDNYFCGTCQRDLGRPFHTERTVEDLDERGAFKRNGSAPVLHFLCCPWCGARFDPEWWRDKIVQNQRVEDHYASPGTHGGDTHVFLGSPGDHWLTSSDRTLCWCNPTVEPGLMGCTVTHDEAGGTKENTK